MRFDTRIELSTGYVYIYSEAEGGCREEMPLVDLLCLVHVMIVWDVPSPHRLGEEKGVGVRGVCLTEQYVAYRLTRVQS